MQRLKSVHLLMYALEHNQISDVLVLFFTLKLVYTIHGMVHCETHREEACLPVATWPNWTGLPLRLAQTHCTVDAQHMTFHIRKGGCIATSTSTYTSKHIISVYKKPSR